MRKTSTFADDESINDVIHKNEMEGTDTDMKRLGTKVRVVEGKHTGTKEQDWKSNHLVNEQCDDTMENCMPSQAITDMNIEDMNHEEIGGIQPGVTKLDMKSDLSTEIHAVSIAQGEVVKNGYVRIERPDRKSNHLVDTQSVNKIEFFKHNQEESNMH